MGSSSSKQTSTGTLTSNAPKSLENNIDKNKLPSLNREKVLGARVPASVQGVTNGKQLLTINFDGKEHKVTIPAGLKAGDAFKFNVKYSEGDKVYTSTLPSLPGMEIVEAYPVIFGSVSLSHRGGHMGAGNVSELMNDAKEKLIEQCMKVNCNAVLGISFTVTNDSSGERGEYKIVLVTCCGTPCVVQSLAERNASSSSSGSRVVASSVPLAPSAPYIPTVVAESI